MQIPVTPGWSSLTTAEKRQVIDTAADNLSGDVPMVTPWTHLVTGVKGYAE